MRFLPFTPPTAMRAPDFFIVGAAKSGTTSLFHYLVQHPSVYIPPFKEPHYFSEFYDGGTPNFRTLEDYLGLFAQAPDDAKTGDASTSYLYSEVAAKRIYEIQPQARIIAVLRNPIDRAYSFYWHNRRDSVEKLSFEEALDEEPRRIRENRHFRFHYVQSGLYTAQVRKYLDLFGPNAVRVYLFEDLHDAAGLCRHIFSFLGVDPSLGIETDKVHNPSGPARSAVLARVLVRRYPLVKRLFPEASRSLKYRLMKFNVKKRPPMQARTRARLVEAFRGDVLALEALIDRDLGHWLVTDNGA